MFIVFSLWLFDFVCLDNVCVIPNRVAFAYFCALIVTRVSCGLLLVVLWTCLCFWFCSVLGLGSS